MKRAIAGLLVLSGLVACTSSTSSPDEVGCADISGNYSMKESVTDSDCPNQQGSVSTNSVTLAKENGGYGVVLPGTTGSCPGTLDAATCRFQAQCIVTGTGGATKVTYNADWTFAGKSFKGSMVGAVAAGVAGPKACSITETDEATRL